MKKVVSKSTAIKILSNAILSNVSKLQYNYAGVSAEIYIPKMKPMASFQKKKEYAEAEAERLFELLNS